MAANWCTVESDPGVFTELIQLMGVKDVQVEECYDLDSLGDLQPVYGLVFLFKWQKEDGPERATILDPVPGLFFAKQMIHNACATQAIISVLLNRPEIEIGPTLAGFKEFTLAFPPDMRGMALTNSEEIRKAHNSFARPEPFVIEESKNAKSDEDAFHFITYIPYNGTLYELDGLQSGPIILGECTNDNWVDMIKPHIQERIGKYQQNEIRFNLMGIIKNRKTQMTETVEKLETLKAGYETQLNGGDPPAESDDVSPKPSSPDEVRSRIAEIMTQIASLNAKIKDEEDKFDRWRVENIRRKHNYIPFIFNMLKTLGKKDQLQVLINRALEKEESKQAESSCEAVKS